MGIIYVVEFYFEKNNSLTKTNLTDARIEDISKILNTSNFKKKNSGVIQTISNSNYYVRVTPNSINIAFKTEYNIESATKVLEVFVNKDKLTQTIVKVINQIQYEPLGKVFDVLGAFTIDKLSHFVCRELSFLHVYEEHIITINLSVNVKNDKGFINIESQCILKDEDDFHNDYFEFILKMYKDNSMKELKNLLGDDFNE